MDNKIAYSLMHFIAAALTFGGLIVVALVAGLLFHRERARELVAVIRRAVKRVDSQ